MSFVSLIKPVHRLWKHKYETNGQNDGYDCTKATSVSKLEHHSLHEVREVPTPGAVQSQTLVLRLSP